MIKFENLNQITESINACAEKFKSEIAESIKNEGKWAAGEIFTLLEEVVEPFHGELTETEATAIIAIPELAEHLHEAEESAERNSPEQGAVGIARALIYIARHEMITAKANKLSELPTTA